MEMACGKVDYVPEMLYWYNSMTGSNDWRQIKTSTYQDAYNGILSKKPYLCIEDIMRKDNSDQMH